MQKPSPRRLTTWLLTLYLSLQGRHTQTPTGSNTVLTAVILLTGQLTAAQAPYLHSLAPQPGVGVDLKLHATRQQA